MRQKTRRAAALSMRVTQDTRDALEALAGREGRSVSQVAERLLDQAMEGKAALADRLGGGGVAATLLALADFAAEVAAEVGDPEKDLTARDALLAGWRVMIGEALPFTPDTPEGAKSRAVAAGAKAAVSKFLNDMRAENEAGTLSDDEALWFTAKPNNALAPSISPFFERLIQYRYGDNAQAQGLSWDLIAELQRAPATLARLRPSPSDLAQIMQERMDALEIYMAPRRAAVEKGRALAESRLSVEPVI